MHYKRWLRTGTPVRGMRERSCDVDGCDRPAKSRGWCHAHYQRWRATGDVQAARPLRSAGPCQVLDCDRQRYARGLCNTHYRRLLNTGEVRAEEPIRMVTGEGHDVHGYWIVPVPPEERMLTRGATLIAEHRLVMARSLGRALHDDEVVHHVNGDRCDNRLDNLELWSTSHPAGQRLEDKVEHAVMLLQRYAPERLAGRGAPQDGEDWSAPTPTHEEGPRPSSDEDLS
jgi:hypothetical protein